MKTQYAGAERILPQIKGNLTIRDFFCFVLFCFCFCIVRSIVFIYHRSLSVGKELNIVYYKDPWSRCEVDFTVFGVGLSQILWGRCDE